MAHHSSFRVIAELGMPGVILEKHLVLKVPSDLCSRRGWVEELPDEERSSLHPETPLADTEPDDAAPILHGAKMNRVFAIEARHGAPIHERKKRRHFCPLSFCM